MTGANFGPFKKKAVTSLVFAASVASFAHPLFCVETIQQAQTNLSRLEAVKEQDPGGYGRALFCLAEAYYLNKQDEQAESTFRQCLPYYFASNKAYQEGAVASALLNWAGVLLKGNGGSIDLSKIDSLTLEGLSEIDKVDDKLSRLQTYQGAILIFSKTGNSKEEQRCVNFLLNSCAECEANSNADLTQNRRAVANLSWIARRIFPLSAGAIKRTPSKEELEKCFSKRDEIETAEKLVGRALRLCERSVELRRDKVSLHRQLARWYYAQGKVDRADEQDRLAKKFAPLEKPSARRGCVQTVGTVTGPGVITGACGMG